MKKTIAMAVALLFTFIIQAQAVLTGKVTNDKNEPLIGANVMIKGDPQTVTDKDGKYEFHLSSETVNITVFYTGYQVITQVVDLQDGVNEFNFTLKEISIQLDELIVKSTRADAKTPMTFINLNKEKLEKINLGQDVPFLLQWTPSTVVTSDAGAGIGYTGIWIRGSDPTRINVTINGIPYNDAESQGTFWVNLPDFATSTNDIQIQRGVGTSTNGAGAFGATINLNTSKLQPDAYANMNGSYGSFNTWKGNMQFGTGLLNNKFTIDGRLSQIKSDGWIQRAASDLNSYYISGAMINNKSLLRLNVFSGHETTYQAWNGVPAAYLENEELRNYNSAGTEKEGEPYDNEVDNYRQTHYQLLYNNQITNNWNLNTALHYTRGLGYFEQYKAEESFTDYNFNPIIISNDSITSTNLIRQLWLDNHFYGAVYALNYNNNRLDATIGGGYHIYEGEHYGKVIWAQFAPNELGDQYYNNDARKSDFNIYTKFNYAFTTKWNAYLDLQYRQVHYTFLGFNNDLENVEQSADLHFFNPKAGIFFKPTNNIDFYASFAVANREPNRNDYTESTPDSRPKPERLYNTEIGYRQNWDKASLGINFYNMYYRDQLALNGQINDVGAFTRINIDRSYRLGVELMGSLQILPTLQLGGNATLSRNKVKAFTEFVDVYDADFNWLEQQAIAREDTDISFSPNIIAGLELSWSPLQGLSLTLSNKYVGKQYIDNTSDEINIIDAYTFTNARLGYTWKSAFAKEIAFTLLIQNIFNAEYETNAWSYRYIYDGATSIDQGFYPQAGTNFLLGLSVGF
ncbi:MAG: TonB-dependent receptor [Saprospiraceae bacterium]|nr:TonB-dependent receptor [Saprospiraceae bacterium]